MAPQRSTYETIADEVAQLQGSEEDYREAYLEVLYRHDWTEEDFRKAAFKNNDERFVSLFNPMNKPNTGGKTVAKPKTEEPKAEETTEVYFRRGRVSAENLAQINDALEKGEKLEEILTRYPDKNGLLYNPDSVQKLLNESNAGAAPASEPAPQETPVATPRAPAAKPKPEPVAPPTSKPVVATAAPLGLDGAEMQAIIIELLAENRALKKRVAELEGR